MVKANYLINYLRNLNVIYVSILPNLRKELRFYMKVVKYLRNLHLSYAYKLQIVATFEVKFINIEK